MIIELVLGLLVLGSAGYLCWQAASGRGRQSRLGWLLAAAEAALMMIMARLLLSWAAIPPLLWLLPIMIMAVAAALVVRRWSQLPWLRVDRKPSTTIAWSAVGTLLMAGAGVLLLG